MKIGLPFIELLEIDERAKAKKTIDISQKVEIICRYFTFDTLIFHSPYCAVTHVFHDYQLQQILSNMTFSNHNSMRILFI